MLNNRIDSTELIRIAEAVAAEKSIDKDLVLTSMETAIEKAARTRYGTENDIYVSIDRQSGIIELGRKLKVVEKVLESHSEIGIDEAKEKGYVVSRDKSGNENNPYHYEWYLKSDSSVSGITNSLSQVATDIFNHLTDNKHVEYQQKVKQELADKIQDDVYFDQGL